MDPTETRLSKSLQPDLPNEVTEIIEIKRGEVNNFKTLN